MLGLAVEQEMQRLVRLRAREWLGSGVQGLKSLATGVRPTGEEVEV